MFHMADHVNAERENVCATCRQRRSFAPCIERRITTDIVQCEQGQYPELERRFPVVTQLSE